MGEGVRYKDIDILRGLLIISVVFGHMEIYADIMYWFHMPAFFILAGMCYKYRNSSLKETIKQVLLLYYIPYWSYFWLCRLRGIKGIIAGGFETLVNVVARSAYGGSIACETVAWYIACLILVIVLYKIIENNRYKGVIILICYLLARVESYILQVNEITFSCI